MFVAQDIEGNRLYADEYDEAVPCYCSICGESLIYKKGDIKRSYFSHKANTKCEWGLDKDSKSEWHIRMQEYFPKEAREVRFVDSKTGEQHIADVFVQKHNTIIEFQKSNIEPKEFIARTNFHINNGRRIVWVFDESRRLKKGENTTVGKLQKTVVKRSDGANNLLLDNIAFIHKDLKIINGENDYNCELNWRNAFYTIGDIYKNLWFKWLYRRKVLSFSEKCPDIIQNADVFCVCIYTGEETDRLHKIIAEENGFKQVLLSIKQFGMESMTDLSEFFLPEEEWIKELPWVKKIEGLRQNKEMEEINRLKRLNEAKTTKWKRMRRINHL